MNADLIIGILTAVIEIILVFSVIRTAENTKEMVEILDEISKKLDNNKPSTNGVRILSAKTDSWVCSCGARNYSSKTCSKCGASKDSR